MRIAKLAAALTIAAVACVPMAARADADVTPPHATFTSADGSVFIGVGHNGDTYGGPNALWDIAGTAVDDVAVESVTLTGDFGIPGIFKSGYLGIATLNCTGGTCTWTQSPAIEPGRYTIKAVAKDTAGNVDPNPETITIVVV